MRCVGIFSDSMITNFLMILTGKKCENWSIFDEVIRRTKSVPNILGHPVYRLRRPATKKKGV